MQIKKFAIMEATNKIPPRTVKSPEKDGCGSDTSAPCQVRQVYSQPIEALLAETEWPVNEWKKPIMFYALILLCSKLNGVITVRPEVVLTIDGNEDC